MIEKSLLHCQGEEVPFDFSDLKEDFIVPCSEIKKALSSNLSDCINVLTEFKDTLSKCIEQAEQLALYASDCNLQKVLCHTDIHGWNLMQSDRLILIDWENLKLAPAESDLYNFWGAHFWESYWDEFLSIYRKYHPEFRLGKNIPSFYQLRRRLEDIDAFYRMLCRDRLSPGERETSANLLRRECLLLKGCK